jgi:hypothetical protein
MRARIVFLCCQTIVLLLASAAAQEKPNATDETKKQTRLWTDNSGQFRVKAELVAFDGEKVYLRRSDGKPIPVPMDRLSDDDQQFVRRNRAPNALRSNHNPARESDATTQTTNETSVTPSLAARERRGDRYALLIAVRDYHKVSGLRPLAYTQNDVNTMADILRHAGYRPENVVVMTESCAPKAPDLLPERNKILKQLSVILRDRKASDTVLVAVAGHGVYLNDRKESCFCPLDARLDDHTTLVSMKDVYSQLDSCSAGIKLLFYDACRNTPLRSASRGLDFHVEAEAELVQLSPPRGIAAFFSCSENEVAFEDSTLRQGVFFYFVIEGMRGAADFDKDRKVTLPELEQFVKKRVSDYVRSQFGGKRQMPNLVGNTSGLVALVDLAVMPPYKPPATDGLEPISLQIRKVLPTTSNFLAFSPDGEFLALQGTWGDERTNRALEPDETIRLWGAKAGRERKSLLGHVTPTYSAAFSPNGKYVAAGAYDGTIRVWDVPTGELRHTLKGHKTTPVPGKTYGYGPVSSVAFSTDGNNLASSTWGEVVLWDMASGRMRLSIDGHAPAFSPDGKKLAFVGSDGAIRVTSSDTGKEIAAIAGQEHEASPDAHTSVRRRIGSLTFSPDGALLAGACGNDVKLWDTDKAKERATLEFHTKRVLGLAYSSDGTLLASTSMDETIGLWDPAACALRAEIAGNSRVFKAVAFSPDGKILAASTTEKRTMLWALRSEL